MSCKLILVVFLHTAGLA